MGGGKKSKSEKPSTVHHNYHITWRRNSQPPQGDEEGEMSQLEKTITITIQLPCHMAHNRMDTTRPQKRGSASIIY
jgi:hypothetical protein